ncbi:MAG: hypothetical protein ACOYXY_15605, partial [Thermodesulfobacteriota bacterium]
IAGLLSIAPLGRAKTKYRDLILRPMGGTRVPPKHVPLLLTVRVTELVKPATFAVSEPASRTDNYALSEFAPQFRELSRNT